LADQLEIAVSYAIAAFVVLVAGLLFTGFRVNYRVGAGSSRRLEAR